MLRPRRRSPQQEILKPFAFAHLRRPRRLGLAYWTAMTPLIMSIGQA